MGYKRTSEGWNNENMLYGSNFKVKIKTKIYYHHGYHLSEKRLTVTGSE